MKKSIFSLLCSLLCAAFLNAATVNVAPGSGTLKTAITSASAGDILVLSNGTYTESSLKPTVGLTIKAAGGTKPVISLSSRFEITADFALEGVTVNSSSAETVRMVPGSSAYDVTIKNCDISGSTLTKVLRVYNTDQANPYINRLTVDGCFFHKMGTSTRVIEAVKTPIQLKNLEVKNSTFDGGSQGIGRIIYLHSGSDDSVIPLQGSLTIDHCTFYNSVDTRGVYLANIDRSQVTNCIFMNTEERPGAVSFAMYGANSAISNCVVFNAPIKIGTGSPQQTNCVVRNPFFVDAPSGNFQLYANSPAVHAGTGGSTIGDPRWGVSEESYNTDNDPYVPYKMPYSMAPTTNSVKVLWQMNEETEPTPATVFYGTDSTNLNMQITTSDGWYANGEGYVHVVTLPNLQPNTRYYFTVGANTNRRCPKISWTKTAPEQGTAYRIFSISDIHGNACNNWSNMQDFICALNCDIALMNGDFVSSKGNDRNWNNYYFKPGEQFLGQVPCMSSPGNHETGDPRGVRWSSFYDYFHQFPHEGASEGDTIDPRGESYFHFVYGNADVIILNLNFDESSPKFQKGCKQYQWADSVLNACTRPWIIVCHHVGIYTTGYHGQWSEEPKQAAPLLEKYAAQGKHIISLSGDDHSFEHLYKNGVHYVRPGCGRDANYSQQKQLIDYKYSLFYRKVSCFSTLDMSADASSIHLTAYDSVGTPFYTYDFLLEGNIINPSINITTPSSETNIEDSVLIRWSAYDPANDATISLYYSPTDGATSTAGLTPIVTNLNGKTEKYTWQTRSIMPKGKYYLYAAITSGGQTFMASNTVSVNLMDDTTPPPAPSGLTGYKNNGKYLLVWQNPTRLVHMDHLLTHFDNGVDKMVTSSEEGASMQISNDNGALKCDYSITTPWTTGATEYTFDVPADMHQTPVLTFRLKGNSTSTAIRLVCKNLSNGHEDWWYTEKFTLSKNTWQTYTIDLRTLRAFDWHANTDEQNRCEAITQISFGVSTGTPVSGTFYLDDLSMGGDVYPAPDYAQTVIVRNDNSFPSSPQDGTEIYRGTEEHCIDQTAIVGQVYYYGAFASDDRNNWSLPESCAQWKSENVPAGNDIDIVESDMQTPQKFIRNGQIFLRRANNTYSLLGTKVE